VSKGRRREDLPRRLGEVLSAELERLQTSEQARAYVAWARAVGLQVASATRPRAFGRGRLTVECASSVWAGELTYLSTQILRRMDDVAPGHPVEHLRFVIARQTRDLGPSVADSAPAAPRRCPNPGAYREARREAERVSDERLREAILACLRRASGEPPETRDGNPSGS